MPVLYLIIELFNYLNVAIVDIVVYILLFGFALLRSCCLPSPKNFTAQYDPVTLDLLPVVPSILQVRTALTLEAKIVFSNYALTEPRLQQHDPVGQDEGGRPARGAPAAPGADLQDQVGL
jgi:hypothetical protein